MALWRWKWNMKIDSVMMYGKPGSAYSISADNGKTWSPQRREPAVVRETGAVGDLTLPNGDRLEIGTPEALKAKTLKLPEPVGTIIDDYTKAKRFFYRVSKLPPALQGVYLRRLPKGATNWQIEHATLEDPELLRYSLFGLLPVVWWGDLRLAADGSIIAGMYPGYTLSPTGAKNLRMNVSFYRSTDEGHSWKLQGRIYYQPDAKTDPLAAKRAGYTEPAFEILADGTFLCVLRTTDGAGNGPLYTSRSQDQGVTWSKPEAITNTGVLPRLLRLSNGVIVLSAGRPGVQLRFNTDGQGKRWTEPFELLPYKDSTDQVTCGLTGLLATGPNRFLVVYSDLKHPEGNELRKAIIAREVIVAP